MNAPRRFLLVARSLKVGGVERNTVNLANALAAMGHEVHVLLLKRQCELQPDPAVRLHVLDFDKAFRLTGVGLILDLVARALISLFLRKSDFIWRGFYGGWYLRHFVRGLERHHGPVDGVFLRGQAAYERVWSWRDPRLCFVVVSPPKPALPGPVQRLHSRLLYQGRCLVANSTGTRAALEQRLAAHGVAAGSITLITNPCPMDRVRALAGEPAPVPGEPYIVHVARLTLQKNQPLLLRAYAASGVSEKLVIVGGGEDERKLRALAEELGIAARVMFVGQQLNPYPWMRHARLFVLSSSYEGLGLVMVESLACGTPVVAVDCPGGVRDVLVGEQAAYIAEPTVEGLAAMIAKGIAHPPVVRDEWIARYEPSVIARQFIGLALESQGARF